jgi:hypothetical protein
VILAGASNLNYSDSFFTDLDLAFVDISICWSAGSESIVSLDSSVRDFVNKGAKPIVFDLFGNT